MEIRTALSLFLSKSFVRNFPVKIRRGLAKGMWWTLLPFSSNWRKGGEGEIEIALKFQDSWENAVCWDLGAHFGIHTVGLGRLVGPQGQVCAFEPDPVAFQRLSRHVGMNRLSQVKIFHAAVSDAEGSSEMLVTGGLGSTFTHFRYEDEPVDPRAKKIVIPTVVLDQLVAKAEIRLPDLIKVDVQGHGAWALAGATQAIQKKKPIIVFSCHCPPEAQFVGEIVERFGYRILDSNGTAVTGPPLSFTETYLLVPQKAGEAARR
jgi:FkbM family methyltransferase